MNSSSTNHQSTSYKSQSNVKRKYKIIILGDSGTGKTSIIDRFINQHFEENYNPTIGIDFLVKNMTYKGSTIRVQLWDTAGQQKFKSLVPSYLKDATAALFVFDQTRPETLKNLQSWVAMFRDNNHQQGGSKNMVGMFCGNKSDLENISLNKQLLYQLMDRYKFPYQSVSAKTSKNIEELFYQILEAIITKKQQQAIKRKKRLIGSIDQQNQNNEDQEGGSTNRAPDTETRLNSRTNKLATDRRRSGNEVEEEEEKKTVQLSKGNEEQRQGCQC